jgi:hypothetical protein
MDDWRERGCVYATEDIKLSFDNLKQLTTLNAGSVVLIGTFLKDIFPSAKGTLDVSPGIKLLIAASFICFGVSLALSAYLMHVNARSLRNAGGYFLWREFEPGGDNVEDYRRALESGRTAAFAVGGWPLPIFAAGLFCFGLAVVLSLYS